jgi:hypothetical protein
MEFPAFFINIFVFDTQDGKPSKIYRRLFGTASKQG